MTTETGFLQGIAYAVAQLSAAGEGTHAANIVCESNYRLSDFIEARVAPYDLKELRRLWRMESRRLKR